jgi:hypothetical protein
VDSHIIPKAFYHKEKGKGVNAQILSAKHHPERSKKGVFDQIVCQEGENSFGLWDGNAAKLLKQTQPSNEISHPESGDIMAYEYASVDYDKLKLFFLSVLWRAHASDKGFFDKFKLPKALAKALTEIVKSGIAPPAEEWAVFVGKSDQDVANVLAEPMFEEIDGAQFARIYLPGYVVHVKLDQSPIPQRFALHLLYPGTGLLAYFYDFDARGETAAAYAMVQSNLQNIKRKSK